MPFEEELRFGAKSSMCMPRAVPSTSEAVAEREGQLRDRVRPRFGDVVTLMLTE
jgi:hypothetical protein